MNLKNNYTFIGNAIMGELIALDKIDTHTYRTKWLRDGKVYDLEIYATTKHAYIRIDETRQIKSQHWLVSAAISRIILKTKDGGFMGRFIRFV